MLRLRAALGLALLGSHALVLGSGCASSSSPPAPKPEGTNVLAAAADPWASPPPPAEAPSPADSAPGSTRIELPGFSVDLPAGELKSDRSGSYDDGEYVIQAPAADGPVVVMAIWAPGGIVGDPVAEQAMVTATARSAGIPLTLRATHDATVQGARVARTYDLSFERIAVVITVVECGRRAVSIAAAGAGDAPDAARAHAVASMRCTPDPAREDAGPPPIELAMPAGWARQEVPRELRWQRGAELVTFVWTTGMEPAHLASFEATMPLFGFDGRAVAAAPIAGRTTWEVRGRGGRLAICVVIPCGTRFALGIYAGTSERDARTWLAQARCPA